MVMAFVRHSLIAIIVIASTSIAHSENKETLNTTIVQAVTFLYDNYGNKGYGMSALTHDMDFGNNGIIKANEPPYTMCVGAQLEVLIQALDIYYAQTRNDLPFHFMPKISWERLRPLDLRGQMWIVKDSPSHGAGDAFANYGMGERVSFKDLKPGSFLNFNRTGGTGHAVIFLGFLDKDGKPLAAYSGAVGGFRYFSSNGRAASHSGGLGYRSAFFSDVGCPTLTSGEKRDCGVIRSEANNLLVGGTLWDPKDWDQSKEATISRLHDATDPALLIEGTFDSQYLTGVGTDD